MGEQPKHTWAWSVEQSEEWGELFKYIQAEFSTLEVRSLTQRDFGKVSLCP